MAKNVIFPVWEVFPFLDFSTGLENPGFSELSIIIENPGTSETQGKENQICKTENRKSRIFENPKKQIYL